MEVVAGARSGCSSPPTPPRSPFLKFRRLLLTRYIPHPFSSGNSSGRKRGETLLLETIHRKLRAEELPTNSPSSSSPSYLPPFFLFFISFVARGRELWIGSVFFITALSFFFLLTGSYAWLVMNARNERSTYHWWLSSLLFFSFALQLSRSVLFRLLEWDSFIIARASGIPRKRAFFICRPFTLREAPGANARKCSIPFFLFLFFSGCSVRKGLF